MSIKPTNNGNNNMSLVITPLLPRARRSSTIADELRRLITTGHLKAGDKLPTEAMLCNQFGVSRTTLREAIQMLRTNGLLEVTPGRGSFVRVPSIKQMLADLALVCRNSQVNHAEVRALRLILTRDILTRIARQPSAKKKDLYQYVLVRQAPPEENAQMELNWHLCMADIAGNSLAKVMLETLLLMDAEQRTKRYADADAVLQTIHIQMRANAALAEGDTALADRVLTQFIDPAPPTAIAA